MKYWKRTDVNHFQKNWQMPQPWTEVLWQIPHRWDGQDDKCPTNPQEGYGHTWNWLSCSVCFKLHRFSFLKVVENKKFNNQIPYHETDLCWPKSHHGNISLEKCLGGGEMDGHPWNWRSCKFVYVVPVITRAKILRKMSTILGEQYIKVLFQKNFME